MWERGTKKKQKHKIFNVLLSSTFLVKAVSWHGQKYNYDPDSGATQCIDYDTGRQ